MNKDFRNSLALAAAGNVALGGHPVEAAQSLSLFLDAFEKFDDLYQIRYEEKILKETRNVLNKLVEENALRDVLPAVMTATAMLKTGASSSVAMNLTIKIGEMVKKNNINSPAALTLDDAKIFARYFEEVWQKLATEVTDLDIELQTMVNKAKGEIKAQLQALQPAS